MSDGYTLLASGEKFFPISPDTSKYDLHSVALGLARTCRFNGQFANFPDSIYSVAQHSILVDDIVDKIVGAQHARPWAILHDAPEGILGDIITPVKRLLPAFAPVEERLAADMRKRAGVPVSDSIYDIVGYADIQACAMEASVLSTCASDMWGLPTPDVAMEELWPDFHPWGVQEATERYEARFREVIGDF